MTKKAIKTEATWTWKISFLHKEIAKRFCFFCQDDFLTQGRDGAFDFVHSRDIICRLQGPSSDYSSQHTRVLALSEQPTHPLLPIQP